MALTVIVCPGCSHHGYVPAGALRRVLRCHACGHAHMVRKGKQVVRARYVEEDESLPIMPNRYVDDSYADSTAPRPATQAGARAGGAGNQ